MNVHEVFIACEKDIPEKVTFDLARIGFSPLKA